MEGLYILVPLLLFICVALLLSHRGLDHNSIRTAVERRGGTLTNVKWSMFAAGNDRVYRVRYLDRDGAERETFCKTTAGEVYFSEDRVIRAGKSPPPAKDAGESLHDENRRLREEVERLRAERE